MHFKIKDTVIRMQGLTTEGRHTLKILTQQWMLTEAISPSVSGTCSFQFVSSEFPYPWLTNFTPSLAVNQLINRHHKQLRSNRYAETPVKPDQRRGLCFCALRGFSLWYKLEPRIGHERKSRMLFIAEDLTDFIFSFIRVDYDHKSVTINQ